MNAQLINQKNEILKVNFSFDNVCVYNSYTVSKNDMSDWIRQIRLFGEKNGYIYNRTDKSWINEWKAHNLLFKLGIQPNRTSNVDLNENESLLRRFGYFILSIFN